MKGFGVLLFWVVVIAVIWHAKVGLSSKTDLVGLFQERPAVGYVWSNARDQEPRMFWETTEVSWQAGMKRPDYKVQSAEKEGTWIPLPGYRFTTDKNLDTVWVSGLTHPQMHAISAPQEGYWIPMPGYRFTLNSDGQANGTEWVPGMKYDDLKIVAGNREGEFEAYPGYRFTNPGRSLDVAWSPGMKNPYNSDQMAGTTEGTWVSAENDCQSCPDFGESILSFLGGKLSDALFGEDSRLSKDLYQHSAEKAISGTVTALQ